MSGLPTGWVWASARELAAAGPASLTDGPFGSNLKTEHYVSEPGPRVIRLQNIGDGVFRGKDRAFITDARFESLRRHEALSGDLLIAALGETLPRVCLVPANLGRPIVKADCFRLRPARGVNARFLQHVLNAPQPRRMASTLISGVRRPRLSLSKVGDLQVPLAPTAEQDRILAAVEVNFSRLDAGIAALERVISRLEQIARAVIVAAIPKDVPSNWIMSTVGDAGHVQLGRQRSPRFHTGPNMHPYLRVANVFEDRIAPSDAMAMQFSESEFHDYQVQSGDILLNEGQSPHLLGRPAMYRGNPPNVAFTNSLLRFQAGEGISPSWALLVFRRHLHARRFMAESQITTNIAHLSAGRFKTIEFPVPPIDEQRQIVASVTERLSSVAFERSSAARSLVRAGHLRSSILAAAFAPKLIPQDPYYEHASVLLKRVANQRASSNGYKSTPVREPRTITTRLPV